MFTGLIEDVGTLAARRAAGKAAKLDVRTALPLDEIRVGESIAVNGACLTVESVQPAQGILTFHALNETLQRTNLAMQPAGSAVNLERAMQLSARLGGHLVLGHVDGLATVTRIGRIADDFFLTVELPAQLAALVIPKGSIAIDGISLTVAELGDRDFSVRIIPHTWAATNLRRRRSGDTVNLEGDVIGKYIARQRQVGSVRPVNMHDLEAAGFLDQDDA